LRGDDTVQMAPADIRHISGPSISVLSERQRRIAGKSHCYYPPTKKKMRASSIGYPRTGNSRCGIMRCILAILDTSCSWVEPRGIWSRVYESSYCPAK